MCTVSIISLPGEAIRLACNRDELRTRPEALPPVVRTFGLNRVVMPIDRESGGTWIAASNAGLIFVLLNYNPHPHSRAVAPQAPLSRGIVIPPLLHQSRLVDAARAAARIDATRHRPFRLVILNRAEVAEFVSDGVKLDGLPLRTIESPLLLTSSGLGDHLVEGPRRELFRQLVQSQPTARRQDEFHDHRWPDRQHLSVRMSRADARTVSRTIVELTKDRTILTYTPLRDDRTCPKSGIDLDACLV